MNVSTEQALENAKKYIEKGINVEGTGFLHLDDWNGNSGHPKWVKNWQKSEKTRKRIGQ